MIIIVVAACPVGLRGHLTRWLLEISPGVFVGTVSTRVRELMWIRVIEMARTGRAIMVHTANNEQGLEFQVHNHDWQPTDFEGLNLIIRPRTDLPPSRDTAAQRTTGWSDVSKRRRFGKR